MATRGKMLDCPRDHQGSMPPLEQDNQEWKNSEPVSSSSLPTLPRELIDNILTLLSPADLVSVAQTCRHLYVMAMADYSWQLLVQQNVPGTRVTSPYPFKNYRDLYESHDPRWFLPKYKIWFSDRDHLAGRLVVVRYDQRRGCIEGYQLVAINRSSSLEAWQANPQVRIHSFEPHVRLHLDKPILHLPPNRFKGPRYDANHKLPTDRASCSSSSKDSGCEVDLDDYIRRAKKKVDRFCEVLPMHMDSNAYMYHSFMLVRPMVPRQAEKHSIRPFPYDNLWPPPAMPANYHTTGIDNGEMEIGRPKTRSEMSEMHFRIRKWLEMRIWERLPRLPTGVETADDPDDSDNGSDSSGRQRIPFPDVGPGVHIGDEVATFATLDPRLYTPTPEKVYQGIWVGDYSGHGCEFLLIHQPDGPDGERFDPGSIVQLEGETAETFAARRTEEMTWHGRLEAVKLTGDPNVPRGECTFVVDDLGARGFRRVLQEPPFTGVRVVKSRGHIAESGFRGHEFVDSELFLISHDRLAQHWLGFGHISYFERVNIDQFLVPE
ncbi:hypothetical protein B0H67DRAFT_125277 [Lasiosphaeris hirsuta]|uniref:F-box domain-containing protein n=1 Tax=Lasiosphaeris hirsuta TaxID=260670 RepID=A0AA40E272_9PEZI|nr:hypothetical protein B0H67DRAFT_125277 [Lasiosphaeris hirsuta]